MEEKNIKAIQRIVGEDTEDKVHRLLDYSANPRDISDPWYTRNFDRAYLDIKEGLDALLEYLEK